jgi:hypothetical protein
VRPENKRRSHNLRSPVPFSDSKKSINPMSSRQDFRQGRMITDHSDPEPPRVQAWLALAFPILAWLSQVFMALSVRRAPAEFYLLPAAIQGLLILGGAALGIWALAKRRG